MKHWLFVLATLAGMIIGGLGMVLAEELHAPFRFLAMAATFTVSVLALFRYLLR